MPTIAEIDKAAADKVREILDRPMPENRDMLGVFGDFDPWDIFPSLYGSYDSGFDECVIEVLTEVLCGNRVRQDLAADMVREMLCTANLCEYGTSPRHCFPTQYFKELLPELIQKWQAYSLLAWGGD